MDYRSLIDPSWELTDPNPDIHAMFVQFNREFFWDRLGSVEVKWSKRMTLCAGLCRYTGKMGLCSIVMSEPLLKLRPRKDLVQTLLHEMIHAFLFVTDNFRDHDSHGPKFVSHMDRINNLTGAHITIYHSFHQEVNHYKVHWWKCDGPCKNRPPYFGQVKRAMNRKPGPYDNWFAEHQRTCGGNFIKIKGPEPVQKKPSAPKQGSTSTAAVAAAASSHKINEYFKPINSSAGSSSTSIPSSSTNATSSSSSETSTTTSPSNTGMVKKPRQPRKNAKKENQGGSAKKTTGTGSNPRRFGGGGVTAIRSGSSTTITTVKTNNNNNNCNSTPSSSGATGQINKKPATNSSFVPFSGQGQSLGSGGSSFVPFSGQGHSLGSGGPGIPPYKLPKY